MSRRKSKKKKGSCLGFFIKMSLVIFVISLVSYPFLKDKTPTQTVHPPVSTDSKDERPTEGPKETDQETMPIPTMAPYEFPLVDSMTRLQSYYLSLEGGHNSDYYRKQAERAGFYVEYVYDNAVGDTVYISASPSLGLGGGAEPWYKYDSDFIEMDFRERDGYAYDKAYNFYDKMTAVEYYYDDGHIRFNRIIGYKEPTIQFPENGAHNDLEKALRYVIDQSAKN